MSARGEAACDLALVRGAPEAALLELQGVVGEQRGSSCRRLYLSGMASLRMGQVAAAEVAFRTGRARARRMQTALVESAFLGALGNCARARRQHLHARMFYQRALEHKRRELGRRHPSTALTLSGIGTTWRCEGAYRRALGWYMHALNALDGLSGAEQLEASIVMNIGRSQRMLGRPALARAYLERALTLRRRVGATPAQRAGLHFELALALADEQPRRAAQLAEMAARIYDEYRHRRPEQRRAIHAWLAAHRSRFDDSTQA